MDHPRLNYTEAAERYISQIVMLKDKVKLQKQLDQLMHFSFEQKVKIGGYDAMAKAYQKEREKNIRAEALAMLMLEKLFQDSETGEPKTPPLLKTESEEKYKQLWFMLNDRIERIVQVRLKREFSKEIDAKFQGICAAEAELLIKSFGPEPHDEEIANKIRLIRDRCSQSANSALSGGWYVPCDQCKGRHYYELTSDQANILVQDGIIHLDTKKSKCRRITDYPDFVRTEPHTQSITLGSLVRRYLRAS